MKAISLWQPWATLLVLGEKRIETRSWSTNFRGYQLIHAAKHWDRELQEMTFGPGLFRDVLAKHGIHSKADLPFGKLVGHGRLVNCLATELVDEITIEGKRVGDQERAFGNYGWGRQMWLYDDLFAREPLAYIGHQGLFDVPESIASSFNIGKPFVSPCLRGEPGGAR